MAITKVDLANTVTGTLPAANGGTGATSFPAPGTSGNVLTSNGTAWTSAAAAAFDSGTVMLFAQTTAPTGWTKDASNYNNYALRVVTGTASTGGSVGFTTAFASQTPTITTTAGTLAVGAGTFAVGATTLSTAQIPSHTHNIPLWSGEGSSAKPTYQNAPNYDANYSTGAAGGGGSHTHSLTGAPSISGSPSSTSSAINLAVQYVDVIRASKD